MDEEEFRELEDTVVFFHTQKHTGIEIEINTKWSATKKSARPPISAPTNIMPPADPQKKKKVTEIVNERERLVMFKTGEIKLEYLCVNGNCTNGSTCCVVDLENGALLPLVETDMLYLAREQYRDPSIAITHMPEFTLTRLRRKALNKMKGRQPTSAAPAAILGPSTPSITYNLAPPSMPQLPPWMTQLAAMPTAGFQYFQPSAPVRGHVRSSPPSGDDESSGDFYRFLTKKANPRTAARLIKVGALLEEKYFTAVHTYHLAASQKQQDRQKLLDLGIEEGIIEKLKSKKMYQSFLDRNPP